MLAYRQLLAVNYATAQDSWYPMVRALEFLRQHDPAQVYRSLLFDSHVKFQYPLSSLLPLLGLRSLGVEGYAAYNTINAAAIVLTGLVFALCAARVLGPLRWRGIDLPVGPVAFLVTLKFYPDSLGLQIGQVQVVLNLFFALAFLAYLHERRAAAGLLVALIAVIKPQFLAFGALALCQRDGRFLAGFSAVTLLTLLATTVLYGLQAQVTYFTDLLPYLSRHGECFHLNQSVNGLLTRYLMDTPCVDIDPDVAPGTPILTSWFPAVIRSVYWASTASGIAMLAIPFVLAWKTRKEAASTLSFVTAGALFTMASPIAWVHHYGVLLPAYVVAARFSLDRSSSSTRWTLLGLLLASFALTGFALASPFAPTNSEPNLLQSHVFFGALLLVGVLLYAQGGDRAARAAAA